ncbi:hypothetical protein [Brevundimonas sp.]|uniref:hypothetical protein n=1 Tax=Brevundimonas sp. TaxID=1871086 RepID=UPI002FDB6D01
MTPDAVRIAIFASWAATGVGLGLWVWSWIGAKTAIQKLRFQDCGMVLVFSAIVARVIVQTKAWTAFDWLLLVLGPIFIAAALWRLTRTMAAGRD